MTDPDTTERSTAEPITAVLADRVRELRERSGMHQAELAERMTKLGTPWKRATVVNIEKRGTTSRKRGGSTAGRDAVTIQELFALAVALDVPPAWLLIDPSGTPVPLVEGVELDPWSALMWMTGRQVIGAPTGTHWKNPNFDLLEKVDRLWQALNSLDTYLHRWKTLNVQKHQEAIEEMVRDELDQVRQCLQGMADAGASLPKVPAEVATRAAELGIELPGQEG